jgi:hypothetical protein
MSNRLGRAARRRLTLTLAAAAALLALGGSAASAQAALPTLNVALSSTTVTVSGATTSGAVNVVTTAAKGLKEPATLLVLLHPGATVAELESTLAQKHSDANSVSRFGAIVFDSEGVPGGTSEAQTALVPGTYVALNIEGEPKGGSVPHAVFNVTASPAPAALPAAGAVEKTIDFGFKGPKTLKVGEVVRFENEGFLVHMNIAFPVRSHKAALKLANALRTGQRGAERLVSGPPAGFFGPMSNGALQQETIAAKPGWYVQACFMATQDGREHTRLGMERIIRIVK